MKNKITQKELVMEYFTKHPKKDIPHPEIVDWVVAELNAVGDLENEIINLK